MTTMPELPYGALSDIYDKLAHHDQAAWSGYVQARLGTLGCPADGTVIDAACGTGGISVRLARAGYRVTGMDISPQMLSRAADHAAREGAAVTFVCQDIRAMKAHRPVDAVVCCCDGVNYLLTEDDVLGFFRSARRSLKKGGALCFDISSSEKLIAMDGQLYGEETADCAYLWSNRLNAARTVLTMDITLFTQQPGGLYRRRSEIHRQRPWTQAELTTLLQSAGYTLRGAYGMFTTEPPPPGCERIQFCAVAV